MVQQLHCLLALYPHPISVQLLFIPHLSSLLFGFHFRSTGVKSASFWFPLMLGYNRQVSWCEVHSSIAWSGVCH